MLYKEIVYSYFQRKNNCLSLESFNKDFQSSEVTFIKLILSMHKIFLFCCVISSFYVKIYLDSLRNKEDSISHIVFLLMCKDISVIYVRDAVSPFCWRLCCQAKENVFPLPFILVCLKAWSIVYLKIFSLSLWSQQI